MNELTWYKVDYLIPDELTRGDNGEVIVSGRLDPEGWVHVWDSSFGWFSHSPFDSKSWDMTYIEVEPVVDNY